MNTWLRVVCPEEIHKAKRLGSSALIRTRHLCVKSCGQCVVCKIGQILSQPQEGCQSSKKPSSCLYGFERRSRFLSFCKSATSWIIERLDGKMADVIGSNIVEKCDIRYYREPSTSYIRCFAGLIFPRIFLFL